MPVEVPVNLEPVIEQNMPEEVSCKNRIVEIEIENVQNADTQEEEFGENQSHNSDED